MLEEIRRYLGREEIVNTIQLAGFLAHDGFDPAQPVLAARLGNDLAAVATLTSGFFLLLSHGVPAAARALAEAAVERELAMPGVMGPADEALAFAESWAARTGGAVEQGMAQRLLAARAVRSPADVPGTCRPMDAGDRPLLVDWFTTFTMEVDGLPAAEARKRGQWMFDDRLDARSGGLLWLDDRGAPVSVACYKAPTTNGIRIGPVYTPSEHRRQGYAGAVTAATTQLMLDRGYAFTCLYTDAANATANHVYESIGYEFVASSMRYRFTGGTT